MSEKRWKRRTSPRTTCDQCGRDYAGTPEKCMTVLVEHPLEGETICLACVENLGITGCTYLRWGDRSSPIEYVLGTAQPPPGWRYKPSTEAILSALASSGYFRPPPTPEPARLDFELSEL